MTIDSSTERAHGNHPDRPDPVLIPLTRGQAARLVRLGLTAAARLGLDVRYAGGAALVPAEPAADGPLLGLSNLARAVSHHEEDRWPALVEKHFVQLLQRLRQGPPTPPADPERELIQRLAPRHGLPPGWTADRADFLPGLVSIPATTQDGVVTMYLDPADFGLTWCDAERFGLANLRRITDHVDYVEDDGIQVAVVTGSLFAASRALVLDTVLRESLHLELPRYGVLAAVPSRDLLLIHVIRDLSVIPALGLMLNLASRSYTHDPGPLSPDVHLVTSALEWHPATILSADSTPLRLSPQLDALTRVLALEEPQSSGGPGHA
ncbi:hypothetical protein E1218_15510 [Kribbella turkmenica]|uniref:Uncharacterized protein n=1 Tax=Kribbella turkmenica TaxID=2530375 RepID=A0A4R4X3Z9_9ACTN|nr:hypothetical protein [Kribbella turkmenica]TDD25018.1 hypothetical protein E1218_15510 [Kribbella turkmenica]